MAVQKIVDILKIRNEEDFKNAVSEFEETVLLSLKPLTDQLQRQLLTQEVQQLELHMTFVESWRDRVARFLMLCNAFENHGKSQYFLLPGGRNITTTDREAYQKGIIVTAVSLSNYLENLLRSIDSRVMICKKLLGNELEGNVNRRS